MKFATIPTYELTLPSTKEIIKYRPYVVKEEKLLLMAMQSEDDREMQQALGDIVSACTFGKVDITTNPMFDIQYVFLKLRCRSVGELSEVLLTCGACDGQQPHVVQLDKIEVQSLQEHNGIIDINGVEVHMRYPTVDTLIKIKESKDADTIFSAVVDCVAKVVTEEEVHLNTPDTHNDFLEFIENLTPDQYIKIQNFFTFMPSVSHTINFTCEKCEKENAIFLDGLYNFFL